LSVGEIQRVLGIPKSTLAHHIAELVSAGLMSQSREGRVQRCRVDAERSRRLLKFLVADCCEGLPDLAELLRAAE
jgi:DNA-binding transcriptional ArsR family regulator